MNSLLFYFLHWCVEPDISLETLFRIFDSNQLSRDENVWLCDTESVIFHCPSILALDRWTEVTISASLKSEVFLPCHFNISLDKETDTVKWIHNSKGARLLRIMNNDSVYFDSTEGRVSVFPLLFKEGNFSILIHDLEPSDIGPYFCERSSERWRVEIIQSEPPVKSKFSLWKHLRMELIVTAGSFHKYLNVEHHICLCKHYGK